MLKFASVDCHHITLWFHWLALALASTTIQWAQWSLSIGIEQEKSKMRPCVKNLEISLKVCVIKLLHYCATPKDCMFYFSLFTFCCKTALSISYKNDVCMRAYVWRMDQLVALWELLSPRKWGEQLCLSVYFGMDIEMDGSESDCRLARRAEQTVDHQSAESHADACDLTEPFRMDSLNLPVDTFTYSVDASVCMKWVVFHNNDFFHTSANLSFISSHK